jgi:hypothetical protein
MSCLTQQYFVAASSPDVIMPPSDVIIWALSPDVMIWAPPPDVRRGSASPVVVKTIWALPLVRPSAERGWGKAQTITANREAEPRLRSGGRAATSFEANA